MKWMNCSQSATPCLPKMQRKIPTMTSLVMSLGSSTMESRIKRTMPTSLKQLEARRKATPAALTASPSMGSTFWVNPHPSQTFLASSMRAISSAWATVFSEFSLRRATCWVILGLRDSMPLTPHWSWLTMDLIWARGSTAKVQAMRAIKMIALDIVFKLDYYVLNHICIKSSWDMNSHQQTAIKINFEINFPMEKITSFQQGKRRLSG